MKILVLPSWYPPQGGSFFKNQAEALKKNGANVQVIYVEEVPLKRINFRNFKGGVNYSIENNVPTYRSRYIKLPKVEKINMLRWVKKTLELFEIYAKENSLPDLIHVHSTLWAGLAAKCIKEKYGVPYVVTEHRGRFTFKSHLAKSMFKPWYDQYLESIICNANAIIPVSSTMIPKLKSFCPGLDLSFYPLPNQVNTDFFIPLSPKNRSNLSSFQFLTICNLVEEKGLDILLPAFKIVLNNFPTSTLLIGGEGHLKAYLKKLALKLKIEKNVIFLGRLTPDEVREAFTKSNAFVLASRVEAQGVVTIEAMAMGIPVVGTDVLSLENLPSEVGIRVKAEDVNALSDGMLRMISNSGSYEPAKIRKFAIDTFSEKVIANKIIEIYKASLN